MTLTKKFNFKTESTLKLSSFRLLTLWPWSKKLKNKDEEVLSVEILDYKYLVLTKGDVKRLGKKNLLNDSIIDFWLRSFESSKVCMFKASKFQMSQVSNFQRSKACSLFWSEQFWKFDEIKFSDIKRISAELRRTSHLSYLWQHFSSRISRRITRHQNGLTDWVKKTSLQKSLSWFQFIKGV